MRLKARIVYPLLIPLALSVAFFSNATLLPAQSPSRVVGTITAISGNTLTVKTDTDGEQQVVVPAAAPVKRVAPGEKNLSTAAAIQFSDLATGDRVLIKLSPDSTGSLPQALQVIAIKQTDVAAKQQKDRDDWQHRGVGGLVKSIDAQVGQIIVATGYGATAKAVTVHVTKATILKRYAPASVRFDDARPAPIDAIHTGDQLRARGQKNADSTAIDAEEIVSGTFRNISGTVSSLDPASSTIVVKDLATKKPVTIHLNSDAQMRRLPETAARMIAARFKNSGESASPPAASPQGASHGANGNGGGDTQQMLNRLPPIQLADLKKGDAVMLVSTDGTTDVTGITLLAGVEPLLEAPAASQSLLNNWSLGGSSAETAAQ